MVDDDVGDTFLGLEKLSTILSYAPCFEIGFLIVIISYVMLLLHKLLA